MSYRTLTNWNLVLLAGVLASSTLLSGVRARGAQAEEKPAGTGPAVFPQGLPLAPKVLSPSSGTASSNFATMMYRRLWGVDSMEVREASSGFMLRFSFRVVDCNKAKVPNDKRNTPYLIDEATNLKMEIPEFEKIGQLRQTATPENGRQYWMIFSNKGSRPGSRVDIVIGNFRVNGLLVESAQPRLARVIGGK